jgi:hypothetical protein
MHTEIRKVAKFLSENKIPYEFDALYDGYQIGYPKLPRNGTSLFDIIVHKFSYGGTDGLLETMGLSFEEEVGDSVEGWLTGEEVIERIKRFYPELVKQPEA